MAEAVALGTATVPELIRETDLDVILAIQAVHKQAFELQQARDQRLASLIADEVTKRFS